MAQAVQVQAQAEILVSHDKALADYLGMGTSRSLNKLIQLYTTSGLKPPAISTMKAWSTKYGWQDKASAYDLTVQQTTHDTLAQKQAYAQAMEVFDFKEVLSQCIKLSLIKAVEAIEDVPIKTLSDVERILRIAKEAAILQTQFNDRSLYISPSQTQKARIADAEKMVSELFG